MRFPPVLHAATNGVHEIEVEGGTVRAALDDAARRIPALKLHLFDEAGRVRHHIICIHDSAVVRPNEMSEHQISDGDEIILANAFAGG